MPFFNLTEAELAEKLPSGKQAVIRNRVAWSRTYMNKAGDKLAALMIEYGLDVTAKQTYAIKQIDSDYFNED